MSEPGNTARKTSPLARVAAFCAHHPWGVVAASSIILILALASLQRLHVSASLVAMLGTQSAAARAFQTVITDFQGEEALLVLVEPEGTDRAAIPTPEQSDATIAFADTLVTRLLSDPRTADHIAWARSRKDPVVLDFVTTEMVPNGPFYLGPPGTQALLERFKPQRLQEQFARNESLISSPGPTGDALSRAVLQDPLRLFELTSGMAAGESGNPIAVQPAAPGPELSRDGHAVLVRISPRAPLSDLEAAQSLVRAVTAVADELSAEIAATHTNTVPKVHLGGGFAIAAVASRTIRSDAIISTLVSIGLLYGLFVVFYRRWLTPILIGLVAGFGLLVGFGINAAGAPTISPLAAAVAALLAGLGVDFGIHFVSHFDELRSRGYAAAHCATETARDMALPITTNCFTSIFGFLSLWPSKIAMLSDFAKLGAAGLVGAWVATFTLLPALLVLTNRSDKHTQTRPPRFGVAADIIAKRPRLWLSTSFSLFAIVAIIALARGVGPRLEGDLTVLHPRPNAALQTTDEIISRFAEQGELIPVLVTVTETNDLLPTAIDVGSALMSDRCRSLGVVDVVGAHRLLPDPRSTPDVQALLATTDVPQLLTKFDAAVNASAFEASSFATYREFLERLLKADSPPSWTDLARYPSLARRLLPTAHVNGANPTQTLVVVRLESPLRDRVHRAEVVSALRAALEPFPQATVAGLAAVSEDLEDATRQGLPQSVAISIALVLIWLVIVFRRPLDVIMALVPLMFAGSFTVAFMMATGTRFNPINSIAIPLMDGIAVDAGVFLVSVARQARREGATRSELIKRLRPTLHAVLLASATTVTGFASLCATHTPAIQSLGFIAAIGITASFCGAAGILVPWILHKARRNERLLTSVEHSPGA